MPDQSTAVSEKRVQTSDKGRARKEIETHFKSQIEASHTIRKRLVPKWKRNIEMRLGETASLYTQGLTGDDEMQSELNPDWSLTKTKTANLYSQVPTVQGTHEKTQFEAAVSPFMKQVNYELSEKRANIGVPMEEVLNDVVNAAGVGAIYVGYAARFIDKTIPALEQLNELPPEIRAQLTEVEVPEDAEIAPDQLDVMLAARQLPVKRTKQLVSDKIFGSRISPSQLLWPPEFTGSNFDDADWIGRTGRMNWAEGKHEFNLADDQKDKVLGASGTTPSEELRDEMDRGRTDTYKSLDYDELYYWRYRVDPDELSFKAIWKLVFVHGIEKPVIHEPWKGQKYDEESYSYVGNCIFPIQLLTLTYITDHPIPPSDSAAGRPQVNDLRRSRRDMFLNRNRSIPIRGFDVNRIDPLVQEQLMNGTWQNMIPCNGNGQNAIWEIARASYPSEDFSFDQQAKTDLMESWQVGPNQLGSAGVSRQTAAETNTVQQNFATRIGQERGRVAAFFLRVVQLIAGYMALYSEFSVLTDTERQTMEQAWDRKRILHDLVFKIRPDSQVVLDTGQRLERIYQFINMTGKSGFVNIKPLIVEASQLAGFDPATIVVDPQPQPEEPNVSYRFSGKDDLMNPVVMAMLIKQQKAPSLEEVEQAKQLLMAASQSPDEPDASTGHTGQIDSGPGAAGPAAPEPPPPGSEGASGSEPGSPPFEDNPDWTMTPKIAQRSEDMTATG